MIMAAIDSLAIAVSDANGPTISDSITNVLCFGGNNGEIDLTVQGSNPFSFSWTGPAGFADPGTEDLTTSSCWDLCCHSYR